MTNDSVEHSPTITSTRQTSSVGLNQIEHIKSQVASLRHFLDRLKRERQQSNAFDDEDVMLVMDELRQAEQTLQDLEDKNRRRLELLHTLDERRTFLIEADEETRVFQYCPGLCQQFQDKEQTLREMIQKQLPEE